MSLHETKYCPRCHSSFECKSGSISLCQCSNIILSEREKEYLSKSYDDCLCVNCMLEIKEILKNVLLSEESVDKIK